MGPMLAQPAEKHAELVAEQSAKIGKKEQGRDILLEGVAKEPM